MGILFDIKVSYYFLHFKLNGVYTEDSAVVEPCIAALRNLSASLYVDMKTETQVQFVFSYSPVI